MLRVLMFFSLAVACTACQQADRDAPAQESDEKAARPSHVTPHTAYDHACAGCHETGKDGAPRTGDRDAWAGRSALCLATASSNSLRGHNWTIC